MRRPLTIVGTTNIHFVNGHQLVSPSEIHFIVSNLMNKGALNVLGHAVYIDGYTKEVLPPCLHSASHVT